MESSSKLSVPILPKGLIAKSTINFIVPLATLDIFLHNAAAGILFSENKTKSHQYLKNKFHGAEQTQKDWVSLWQISSIPEYQMYQTNVHLNFMFSESLF